MGELQELEERRLNYERYGSIYLKEDIVIDSISCEELIMPTVEELFFSIMKWEIEKKRTI